jgi:UDP-N-acetylmuramoyl-L-alanyl-D-glutamate--2,6-diaminopimelate ligase
MKYLKDILYGVRIKEVIGSTNIAVELVSMDSRKVGTFGLFAAVKGTTTDGHEYIDKAIENGAIAIICQDLPAELKSQITYVQVSNSAEAIGIIASNFYDNPSEELKLLGVTGTNGKTTCATLLFDLHRTMGYSCGLLSTVQNRINGEVIPATHTTPDCITLNALLRQMADRGCEFCFMEVSSHAMAQHRVSGLVFRGGIYTNISHDHLDYHGTFDNYLAAKASFFNLLPQGAFALANRDDYHWEEMMANTKARVITYGYRSQADWKGKILESQFGGMLLTFNGKEVWTTLMGIFNAYNLIAVYTATLQLGAEPGEALTALSKLTAVEGRFQYFKTADGITAIVDYAHTPDALKNVLNTIAEIRTGNEKVITVIGCGGDRDKEKRPVMAKIAAEMSDKAVFTSDNPRSEDPEQIIRDMQAGIDPSLSRKVLSITNRREAIRTACTMAQAGDILLVAGKGHEKYQEIQGVKHDFDDMLVLRETLIPTEK